MYANGRFFNRVFVHAVSRSRLFCGQALRRYATAFSRN